MDYTTFTALVDSTFYANNNKEISATDVNAFAAALEGSMEFTQKTLITNAQLLTMFDTPVVIVTGIAGKYVVLQDIYFNYTGLITPYTGNTSVVTYQTAGIQTRGAVPINGFTAAAAFGSAQNVITNTTTANMYGLGDNIVLKTQSANMTAGNYDITFYASYKIITP